LFTLLTDGLRWLLVVEGGMASVGVLACLQDGLNELGVYARWVRSFIEKELERLVATLVHTHKHTHTLENERQR